MDHFDFENTITDEDFDFTLDDILNEFHTGGSSSVWDDAQLDPVPDVDTILSHHDNNPINTSDNEGASTINTNEYEDSILNGSEATVSDVSASLEAAADEESNPYD